MDTPRLIAQLADGTPLARIEAAIALAADGASADVTPALLAATRDPLWQVREAAISSLATLAGDQPEVVACALELALHDVSVWTRATARTVVEQAGGALEAVRGRLRAVAIDVDQPTAPRMRALRLLAPLLHPESTCDATVQALLSEDDWTLRVAAIEACVERRLTGCGEALRARLRDDEDTSVRVAALEALVALELTPDLETRLQLAGADQPAAMRRAAASALGIGSPTRVDARVVDALVAMLDAQEAVVVTAALGALERIAPSAREDVVAPVLACLVHSSDMAVIAAQEALVAIGRRDRGLLEVLRRDTAAHARGVRIGVTRVLLRLSADDDAASDSMRPMLLDLAVADGSRAVRRSAAHALVRSHDVGDVLAALTERLSTATRRRQRAIIYEIVHSVLAQQHTPLTDPLLAALLADLENPTASMRLHATSVTSQVPPPANGVLIDADQAAVRTLLPLLVRRAFEGEDHVLQTARNGLGDRFARWLPNALATTLATATWTDRVDAQRVAEAPLDEPIELTSDAALALLVDAAPEAVAPTLGAWRGHARWWLPIAERRRPAHAAHLAHLRDQMEALDDAPRVARAAARIAALARPTLPEGAANRAQRLHDRLLHGIVREHAWQMSRLLSASLA